MDNTRRQVEITGRMGKKYRVVDQDGTAWFATSSYIFRLGDVVIMEGSRITGLAADSTE